MFCVNLGTRFLLLLLSFLFFFPPLFFLLVFFFLSLKVQDASCRIVVVVVFTQFFFSFFSHKMHVLSAKHPAIVRAKYSVELILLKHRSIVSYSSPNPLTHRKCL